MDTHASFWCIQTVEARINISVKKGISFLRLNVFNWKTEPRDYFFELVSRDDRTVHFSFQWTLFTSSTIFTKSRTILKGDAE